MSEKPVRKEVYLNFDDEVEIEPTPTPIAPPKNVAKSMPDLQALKTPAPLKEKVSKRSKPKQEKKKTVKPPKAEKEKSVVSKNVAFEPTKKTVELPYAQKEPIGKGSMTAFERFIYSIMILMLVAGGGFLILVLTGRFNLPF